MNAPLWLGISEGHWDPAAAIVRNGQVLAYMEEERLVRVKHAPRQYPIHAITECLSQVGASQREIAGIAVHWDVSAYTNGTMARFFANLRQNWPVDPGTERWQQQTLAYFHEEAVRQRHDLHWQRTFRCACPPIHPIPHHFTHAAQAFLQSRFHEALCLTIDGSGDKHSTVLWVCGNEEIRPIREICMPHSLGWLYAAFTEYLGFSAYDGEYKLMGLASHGRRRADLLAKVGQVLQEASDGIEYRVAPQYIHYGKHTWSDRFTDELIELFGMPCRGRGEPITSWHQDVAFAVQESLEQAAARLVRWGVRTTGLRKICISGGVGLNVKMNGKILGLEEVDDIFAHPLCSDGGAAAGAALVACWKETGIRPEALETLALGYEESDATIERALQRYKIQFARTDDVAASAAKELAAGRIVGWFQGRLEAGPRALGQRSILADPRNGAMRDRINDAVKFREPWRPLCPSMPFEEAARFLRRPTDAPFMNIAFDATEELRRVAPAVVHVDGTTRPQLVHRERLPLFHRLLRRFEEYTGVPVLLNTSFNVKGEPLVCTISEALRTFFASGLDVLVAGKYVIRKDASDVSRDSTDARACTAL